MVNHRRDLSPPRNSKPAGDPHFEQGRLKSGAIARGQNQIRPLPIKPLALPFLVGARECALYVGAKREESYQ
jgi:hypothetical protein